MEKYVEIDGTTYTLSQMGAQQALQAALVRGQWLGRRLQAVGRHDENTTAQLGAYIGSTAEMLLDPLYRQSCWEPSLAVIKHSDGRPILATWQLDFRGDKLASLLKLHEESIAYSCGAFLAGLGGAARSPAQGTPETTEP